MYTHLISYTRNVPGLGLVSSSFRTVADAVELHLVALGKRCDVSMIVVESI